MLQLVSDTASTSLSNETAARHMDLTRPFHDRRVVEFALAVPENLYVRDGYNRYLARAAMKDLYPPSSLPDGAEMTTPRRTSIAASRIWRA